MTSANSNDKSRSVSKAIAEVTAQAFELTSREALAIFDELEFELLHKEPDKSKCLEIKRRIAEAKISIIYDRNISRNIFDESWNDIQRLGFSTAEREATMLFYRAYFLIKDGKDRRLTADTINRLGLLVSDLRVKRSKLLAEHFERVHSRLMNDFKAKFS